MTFWKYSQLSNFTYRKLLFLTESEKVFLSTLVAPFDPDWIYCWDCRSVCLHPRLTFGLHHLEGNAPPDCGHYFEVRGAQLSYLSRGDTPYKQARASVKDWLDWRRIQDLEESLPVSSSEFYPDRSVYNSTEQQILDTVVSILGAPPSGH